MDASELLETITQLIQQAEQGEIDPWDVKVIEVIDRYLEFMVTESTPRGYESDLSQSGQAFLSASMLVLFKANSLMELQSAAEEAEILPEESLLEEMDGISYHGVRLPLEKQLRRRPAAMPPPKRRVSLTELIEQLHIMADRLQKIQSVEKPVRTRKQATVKTMRAALDLAHQENLTEVAGELEQVLQLKADELCLRQNWLNLEQLVELWTQTKQLDPNSSSHHSPNSYIVSVFWALLLLSAQSKVELIQEEFYQDVKIRLIADAQEHSSNLSSALSLVEV
ncbi:segregation/condensation protein A [Calothrix rhizosoleniae]|uniref:segregation/condensation protein A n=1 Tax=Calothrix rhizosoleniae TaxID=888997 RepID=UPI000B4A0F8B|nr:ScpA family protein [Calothrix rhizosoleniae]